MKSNLLMAARWLWSLRGRNLYLGPNVLTEVNPDPSAPKLTIVEAIRIFAYLNEKGLLLPTTVMGQPAFYLHEAKYREWNSLIDELGHQTETTVTRQNKQSLAAIVFTDIVGFTRSANENEPLALELLEEHQKLVRSILQNHQGEEVKTTGDGFLLEFESCIKAVKCAVEIQITHQNRNSSVSSERQIRVRIGIHVGEVTHQDNDVLGDAVNVAQRLQSIAEPEQICVSIDVERQVRSKANLEFVRLGLKELKNVREAMDVFRVMLPGESLVSDVLETGASGLSNVAAGDLSADALQLLKETTETPYGIIKITRSQGRSVISIEGGKNHDFLGRIDDPRAEARWMQALQDLVTAGYARLDSQDRFKITHAGYARDPAVRALVFPRKQEIVSFNKQPDGTVSIGESGIIFGRNIMINWTIPRGIATLSIRRISGSPVMTLEPVGLPRPPYQPYRTDPLPQNLTDGEWGVDRTLPNVKSDELWWVLQIRFENCEAVVSVEART